MAAGIPPHGHRGSTSERLLTMRAIWLFSVAHPVYSQNYLSQEQTLIKEASFFHNT